MTGHLTMFSTAVMLTLARDFGVRQVTGKAVNQPSTHNGKNVKPALPNGLNIPVVGSSGDDFEDTSIAFDPTNEQYGYAVTIFDASGGETFSNLIVGEACLVFQTVTGGTTWTFFGVLPLSFMSDTCTDPVVRWSPDGFYAYFAYLSVRHDGSTSDLDFVRTCYYGCGFTLQILFPGSAFSWFLDAPWVDVHQMDNAIVNVQGRPSQANWVYVTFTYFEPGSGWNVIGELSNDNFGSSDSWSLNGPLTPYPTPSTQLVQLARPMGGMYNTAFSTADLLVCWYYSGTDGILAGMFDIQCSHSPDHGADWFPIVNVANNVKYELPFWLCPDDNYEAWWTGMAPSIAITPDGVAHIAFTASNFDPNMPHVHKTDCGDIKYVRSKPFLYDASSSWLPVKTAAGGSLAQGFPTLVAQLRPALPPTSLGYRLYLFYYDAKNSPTSCTSSPPPTGTKCYANLMYDIYMRTSNNGGSSFSSDTRITDQSSMVQVDFVGDYFDSTATSRKAWVIWVDRADQLFYGNVGSSVLTQPVSSQ